MIVYIVTSGTRSKGPRNINAVFGEREQAENYCAIIDEMCQEEPMRIEEWDTEALHIDCKREIKAEWTMGIKPDGSVEYLEERYVFHDVDKIAEGDFEDDGWVMWKTFPRSMPKDQVKESMLKSFEEYR